jgi:cysteine sulfinate desulfinase/cysteine desulfurase-like protein
MLVATLEEEGFKVTYLGVKKDGIIDLEELKKAITKDTSIISVMAVNNEIGVIQPLEDIGKIARENKSLLPFRYSSSLWKNSTRCRKMQYRPCKYFRP